MEVLMYSQSFIELYRSSIDVTTVDVDLHQKEEDDKQESY